MSYWVIYPGTDKERLSSLIKKRYAERYSPGFITTLPQNTENSVESDQYIFVLADGQRCIESLAQTNASFTDEEEYYERLVSIIQARQGEHLSGWADYSLAWMKKADLVIRWEDLISGHPETYKKLDQFIGVHSTVQIPQQRKDEYWDDINWPDRISQFYSARMGYAAEKLGYTSNGLMAYESWIPKIEAIRGASVKSNKILLDIDKLADARYDGVRRYVKNIAVEFQKLSWQGLLPIQIDVFLKKKLMSLNADTPIYDYHLNYESQLLGVKEKIKKNLPDPIYKLGRALYLGLRVRKILAWFRDTIVERRWWMFTDESGKSLKDQLAEYELIHCTLPQHFVYFKDLKVPKIVTLHDMTHEALPHLHREENLKWARLGHKDLSQNGAHLISVSNNTKADFTRTYPEHRGEHTVIYEGVDLEQFGPQYRTENARRVLSKYDVQDSIYFFTLFTLEPRKNLDTVVQSFIRFSSETDHVVKLVIGGQLGWKFDQSIYEHPNIQFTGYIDENDLPVLYGAARGFFYLSQYEGFGLPPLEAMVCGTAVVYGHNSSMTELYGDAAIGINAFDQEACVDAMKHLMDARFAETYQAHGYSKALEFNWGNTARETLAFYQGLLAG